jgi:SAM-dependent methyltransferase
MLQRFLTGISRVPELWNALRWIAEAGYHGEHAAIDAALALGAADKRRFLDFGCGTGQFAARFPARSYVGFDLEREYVRFAVANRHGRYTVMNGGTLGFLPETFDGALVCGVFHHLPDELVRAGMDELRRVLKPEATLLVIEDVPPPSMWNVPGHFMHWLDRGDHIRTDADYRRLFGPHFRVCKQYAMRSGICDYGVYVLARQPS